jgi:hypothetical protein
MLISVWPYTAFTTWKAAVVSWISCKQLHDVQPHVRTKLYTGLMAEYFWDNRISQDILTTLCRPSSTEWGDYFQKTRPFASPFVSIFGSIKWPWQHVLLTQWFDFRPYLDCSHRMFRGFVKSLQTKRLNRLRPVQTTSDIIWHYIPIALTNSCYITLEPSSLNSVPDLFESNLTL